MRLFKVFKRKQPYKFQVQYRYSSNLWYILYRGATKSFGKINQIILTVSLKDRWGGEQFSLNPKGQKPRRGLWRSRRDGGSWQTHRCALWVEPGSPARAHSPSPLMASPICSLSRQLWNNICFPVSTRACSLTEGSLHRSVLPTVPGASADSFPLPGLLQPAAGSPGAPRPVLHSLAWTVFWPLTGLQSPTKTLRRGFLAIFLTQALGGTWRCQGRSRSKVSFANGLGAFVSSGPSVGHSPSSALQTPAHPWNPPCNIPPPNTLYLLHSVNFSRYIPFSMMRHTFALLGGEAKHTRGNI